MKNSSRVLAERRNRAAIAAAFAGLACLITNGSANAQTSSIDKTCKPLASYDSITAQEGVWEGLWQVRNPEDGALEREYHTIKTQAIRGQEFHQRTKYIYPDGREVTRLFVAAVNDDCELEFTSPSMASLTDYKLIIYPVAKGIITRVTYERKTNDVVGVDQFTILGDKRSMTRHQINGTPATVTGIVNIQETRIATAPEGPILVEKAENK